MNRYRYNLLGVSGLMLGSGMCALMYKAVWLRDLRLVFGGSTAASAATLAIFMGGLGLGSVYLGRIADRHPRPLALYANLELAIGCFALVTPLLLVLVRLLYFNLGGAAGMGTLPATLLRLVLTTFVLIVPTFLMGGTLPAAARAVETEQDLYRRRLAVLYGINTLGAVVGISLATFLFLNVLGAQKTLWVSCLMNILVAVIARSMARKQPLGDGGQKAGPDIQPGVTSANQNGSTADRIAPRLIYAAALVVGFTFFLMELVWYRMLGPLLGGSTYTLGLILAVALTGIGLGGGLYALGRESFKPTLKVFAVTCSLEALFIAIPYALGDQLAILTALLQPLDTIGMFGKVAGWSFITGLVIFPAAVIAGFQFPMLIGLLGQGRANIGRHTGQAYAWNTVGAILGSLAGGFGLLPLFSATGAWQVGVTLLAILGGVAALLATTREGRQPLVLLAAGIAIGAVGLMFTTGPTAVWRHSPIGAGRVDLMGKSKNEIVDWIHHRRRSVIWEQDGREGSIGIDKANGISFIVNGKSDGNARFDGSTQVMLGLLSALLHPEPRRAMVVGLGTGSSGGWLARVGSIEQVDIVEIEPAIEEVARLCKPVNEDVLNNSKVHITYGDAREFLMTTPKQYDIIASEPSNPYRAGVASLYTTDFYQAVAERLSKGGIFSQWVQAYEVNPRTIKTIMATLASVFKSVEIWRTQKEDMLLLCSMEDRTYDEGMLRRRINTQPFRSALLSVWGVTDLEGVLARFVAGPELPQIVAREMSGKGLINSDDRMLIEFEFARTVGRKIPFSMDAIHQLALARNDGRPAVSENTVDWGRVQRGYALMFTMDNYPCRVDTFTDRDTRQRVQQAYNRFVQRDLKGIYEQWKADHWVPEYPLEVSMLALAMADAGDREALLLVDRLRPLNSIEALAISARYHWRSGQFTKAGEDLIAAFGKLRESSWAHVNIVSQALGLAPDIARQQTQLAPRLQAVLTEPFAV